MSVVFEDIMNTNLCMLLERFLYPMIFVALQSYLTHGAQLCTFQYPKFNHSVCGDLSGSSEGNLLKDRWKRPYGSFIRLLRSGITATAIRQMDTTKAGLVIFMKRFGVCQAGELHRSACPPDESLQL
jgi:hypothetical protein